MVDSNIPRIIHFVWLGRLPQWVWRTLDAFARMNPGWTIDLRRDATGLLRSYRAAYAAALDVKLPHDRIIRMESDLLRLDILEREGGWYFDTDCIPLRPIADIEAAYESGLNDGNRLFAVAMRDGALHDHKSPRRPRAPVRPCYLAAGPNCIAWPVIHEIIHKSSPPQSPHTYGAALMTWLRDVAPQMMCIADESEFRVTGSVVGDHHLYLAAQRGAPLPPTSAYLLHGSIGTPAFAGN